MSQDVDRTMEEAWAVRRRGLDAKGDAQTVLFDEARGA